jgi:hypothetical protein
MTQYYLGVTLIEAWEESLGETKGYTVKTKEGKTSWMRKDLFEETFLAIGSNSSKITPEAVNNLIYASTVSDLIDKKTTLLLTTLWTGFSIAETNACASPENYNQEIGEKICKEQTRARIWEYLGFIHQWAKNGLC